LRYSLKIYLVGGAVRDQLLGLDVYDRDYVVVGATPEAMRALSYQQVGKDFPVFLHPETHEEYALARTERKKGQGYKGFEVFANPDVTLEQDLQRRDLTINAMALDEQGHLHDPYQGQQDLKDKVLRHVSDAFIEDPLRVLRVARFAARFAPLGFKIAEETRALMQRIALSEELSHLTAERVGQELERALATDRPDVFIEVLHQVQALEKILPEIEHLFGVPQPEKWHPEIDTGLHIMLCLQRIVELTDDVATRFAVLCHDVGKGITPPELWPKHHGHDVKGLKLVRALCQRLALPNAYRDLALLVCEFHQMIHKVTELNPKTLLKMFNRIDVWRKPERVESILLACTADSRGRTGFEACAYPQADYIRAMLVELHQVKPQDLIAEGFTQKALGDQLQKRRLAKIKAFKQDYRLN